MRPRQSASRRFETVGTIEKPPGQSASSREIDYMTGLNAHRMVYVSSALLTTWTFCLGCLPGRATAGGLPAVAYRDQFDPSTSK